LDIVIAAVHVNRSIRSSEIKRGTKNERWKERVEKNGREGRGERFSRWEHEGGGGREGTDTKYTYMTVSSGDT